MKPSTWWRPGLTEGWLSRAWAQAFVFPLPALPKKELEASLRFKVQALVPSADVVVHTRIFRHQGAIYGLALLDRLPEPKPPVSDLFLGMPLVLPSSWPPECLLAVATPEGWEVHGYANRLLAVSYPPFQLHSAMAGKVLAQNSGKPLFWVAPDAAFVPTPPDGAQPAPGWPASHPWGIPWETPKESRGPWALGAVLLLVGIAALGVSVARGLEAKAERNQQWQNWLQSARTLAGAPALSAQRLAAGRAKAGEPLEDLLATFARVWPSGVEIRRFEVSDGKLTVTARAASALAAVSTLAQDPLGSRVRVVQIRPFPGGEEFDLEGKVNP